MLAMELETVLGLIETLIMGLEQVLVGELLAR